MMSSFADDMFVVRMFINEKWYLVLHKVSLSMLVDFVY